MTNLSRVSAEDMDEVLRIASDLYDRDRHKEAIVDAASEVGVPQEYLEMAAQILMQNKAEKAMEGKRRSLLVAGILCALVAVLLAVLVSPLTLALSGPLIATMIVRSFTANPKLEQVRSVEHEDGVTSHRVVSSSQRSNHNSSNFRARLAMARQMGDWRLADNCRREIVHDAVAAGDLLFAIAATRELEDWRLADRCRELMFQSALAIGDYDFASAVITEMEDWRLADRCRLKLTDAYR